MLWNWAILRCSIIEDMDIFWTETLLTKLQFLTFYIKHGLRPGHLLDQNPSNIVAVFISYMVRDCGLSCLEVLILSKGTLQKLLSGLAK